MAKSSGSTRSTKLSATLLPAEKAFIDAFNNNEARPWDKLDSVKSQEEAARDYEELLNLHTPNYTDEQEKAIRAYASGSHDLNSGLRTGDLTERQRHIKDVLDSAFIPSKKEIVVFRGWYNGKEYRTVKGFCSTSTDVRDAVFFAHLSGGLAAFRIPKGTPIIFGNKREKELILPRNFNLSKYRIR